MGLDIVISIIKKILPLGIKDKISYLLQQRYRTYYSACGEDAILNYLFKEKGKGFYIDCGAYDPIESGSNTYMFYLKGWNGINIDARPGYMQRFKKLRPRDINIEAAISDKEEILTYYEIKGTPERNSFSLDFIKKLSEEKSISSKTKIKTQKLSGILDKYLPPKQEIDFLAIDTEGFELKVLKSNNWNKYRPKAIVLESFERIKETNFDIEIRNYLNKFGYGIVAKTLNAIIFIEKSFRLSVTNQIENL